eukprot:10675540-Alexandrium_andersonii.AAC.1
MCIRDRRTTSWQLNRHTHGSWRRSGALAPASCLAHPLTKQPRGQQPRETKGASLGDVPEGCAAQPERRCSFRT